MQFFKSVAVAVSALAAFAAAQSTEVAIHNMPDTVQVGKTTTLQTMAKPGPFTLTLRRGSTDDLQNVSTITTTGTGSSFDWTPSSDLASGSDYAIMISQGDQVNYTPEFTITGGKATSSSSASAPAGYGSSAVPSTMSTAAKSASNCAVTQIGDGQPQAPAGCTASSSAAPKVTSAPAAPAAPKVTPVAGFNSAALPNAASPAPYVPMPGATGSPAASNTTMPTYSMPSAPTSGSSSGSSSSSSAGSKGSVAPKSGAAQFGSSLALVAGAAAAFVFLN